MKDAIAPRTWQALASTHRARIERTAGAYLESRANGRKHAVYDFLFTYYSLRPNALLEWSPGAGVSLHDPHGAFRERNGFRRDGECVALDPAVFPENRRHSVYWIQNLLGAIQSRTPVFGCHGLHEWAMVYRQTDNRHAHPLRLPRAEIDAVVENIPVRCSHYDAFRFFTPGAIPLNRLQPSAGDRDLLEQPGCIHANMDLYRWCSKLTPWISSELLADAFLLAWKAREIDMRASPYDLRPLGFTPIAIETAAGRAEYEVQQRSIAERAEPIRVRLIAEIARLQKLLDAEPEFPRPRPSPAFT